jgi:ATP-binding cassette subfamily B protein
MAPVPPLAPTNDAKPDFAVMRRFLPYLWPKNAAGLRARIVFALLLVVVSKLIQLSMAWLYGQAIDRMVPGMEASVAIAIALVAAYAGARFGGVLFDNLRNIVFERVGQDASGRKCLQPFA